MFIIINKLPQSDGCLHILYILNYNLIFQSNEGFCKESHFHVKKSNSRLAWHRLSPFNEHDAKEYKANYIIQFTTLMYNVII